ncbi:unnamed protein product [Porites lobata]|uniref:Uncharacterized protein n=1 Tax=Porites lobata TaxID=104759 RepID=A0ABN8S4W8_9CNID|nr:unnamed protein product [Porites lobata]
MLLYQLSVVSGHAKVNLYIDPWAACACCRVCTRLRYLLRRLFTSAQLLNIYPGVEAGAYCESLFSLLQEEVRRRFQFSVRMCPTNYEKFRKLLGSLESK